MIGSNLSLLAFKRYYVIYSKFNDFFTPTFVCFRVRNKVIMKNKYGVIIEIEIM